MSFWRFLLFRMPIVTHMYAPEFLNQEKRFTNVMSVLFTTKVDRNILSPRHSDYKVSFLEFALLFET